MDGTYQGEPLQNYLAARCCLVYLDEQSRVTLTQLEMVALADAPDDDLRREVETCERMADALVVLLSYVMEKVIGAATSFEDSAYGSEDDNGDDAVDLDGVLVCIYVTDDDQDDLGQVQRQAAGDCDETDPSSASRYDGGSTEPV